MPKKSGFKPREKAPKSGQYQIISPRGKGEAERTIVKGEPFPPTIKKGSTYTLVDPTKHKKK